MKILHIFSMAGVAEILTDEAIQQGHESIVLQLKSLDPFGFGKYYGNTIYFDNIADLLQMAYSLQSSADYIILHDFVEYYREFPENKLILYFHGTKLRNILNNDVEFNRIRDKFRIIVSTPDLLEIIPEAKCIPTPCDRKLFKKNAKKNGKWLTINRDYQKEFIEKKIKSKYPDVEYRNRQKEIIPYDKMPEYLSQFENYVDWKFDYSKPDPKTINASSCTAIQALSCGCRVWDKDGLELSPMLLLVHDSKIVCDKFLEFLNG